MDGSGGGQDVSAQALSIARGLDRVARAPGCYTVVVAVPAHRGAPWAYELARVEVVRGDRTRGREG